MRLAVFKKCASADSERVALLVLCKAASVAITSWGQLVYMARKDPGRVFAINLEVGDVFEMINLKSSSPSISNLSFSAVCDVVSWKVWAQMVRWPGLPMSRVGGIAVGSAAVASICRYSYVPYVVTASTEGHGRKWWDTVHVHRISVSWLALFTVLQLADLLEQKFSPWGKTTLWVVEHWHPSL